MADGQNSDHIPSAQVQHQEMQIPMGHPTDTSPIIATLVEKHLKNIPLPQASQHSVQISVEKQEGADNLHVQAASDNELQSMQASFCPISLSSELTTILETFNTTGTSYDTNVVNVGHDIITYLSIDNQALAIIASIVHNKESSILVLTPSCIWFLLVANLRFMAGCWHQKFPSNSTQHGININLEPGPGSSIAPNLCSGRTVMKIFCACMVPVSIMYENFLWCLLSQLSYCCGGIPPALTKLYYAHAQPSLESLNDTLRCVVEGLDHVYIIIDPLYKCRDRTKLLWWIQAVASWNSEKLHLLFTSWQEQDIRSQLDNIARVCHVKINRQSQKNILLYLDAVLHYSNWNDKTWDLVKSIMGGHSDRICVIAHSLHPDMSLIPDTGSDELLCKYPICSHA